MLNQSILLNMEGLFLNVQQVLFSRRFPSIIRNSISFSRQLFLLEIFQSLILQ